MSPGKVENTGYSWANLSVFFKSISHLAFQADGSPRLTAPVSTRNPQWLFVAVYLGPGITPTQRTLQSF